MEYNSYFNSNLLTNDLSTYDPYDIWKTNIGIKIKQLYYKNKYLGLIPAGLLSIYDLYVNNSLRIKYKKKEYPIVRAQAVLILLNLYKKDQKKIVAANHQEISESFLYRYFLNDEQHAIKLLLELKPAELAKVMDGLFILDEDYRVFESKYLSEADTLELIKNLNDRRLQKVLQIRESFLLIAYAGRHDLKLITKLFDIAEPRSIQNLFNFCLASEIEKRATHSPRKKKLTDEAAHKMVIEIVFQAHKNRNLSNPVITGLVKLASKPDKVKDLLEEIYTDEARRRFVENLIRDFAEKKTPEKISLINRIQFLTELMMSLAHNRKILYKILENISEENRLIVEELLGVKK